MKKFVIAAAFTVASVLGFVAPVFAASPGQLSNNATNYEVRNVTQNGAYGQTASATCNDTLKYSVLLANSDYGQLKNLTVNANLGTGAITASATDAAGGTTSVSGKVTVSLNQGSLVYVPGSTVRVSSDGATRTPLADGITAGGVNAGDLAGSTQIFVQFQAKVNCPTPPAPKQIQVCDLTTKKIVTINENDFDAAKHTRDLSKCAETPAPKQITVCDLTTKKIVTINESDFNSSKHTKDLAKCAEAPKPGEITVCEIATKKIVNIKETDFNSDRYTKDLSKCATVVTPVTPTPAAPAVIAATGPVGTLATMLGLSGLAAAATYFVRGRKSNILG